MVGWLDSNLTWSSSLGASLSVGARFERKVGYGESNYLSWDGGSKGPF